MSCCKKKTCCTVLRGPRGRMGLRGERGEQGPPGPPGIFAYPWDKWSVQCWNHCYPSTNEDRVVFHVTLGTVAEYPNDFKEPNVQTYLNIYIDSETGVDDCCELRNCHNPIGVYGGWCMDAPDHISVGPQYTGTVVSLLDPDAWDLYKSKYLLPNPLRPINTANTGIAASFPLWAVLWFLNHMISSNETQTAIWTVLYMQVQQGVPYSGPLFTDPSALPINTSAVYNLINTMIAETYDIVPATAYTIATGGSLIMGALIIPEPPDEWQIQCLMSYLPCCC